VKIRPLMAALFHAHGQTHTQIDGQADRHDEGNRRLSQFCEKHLRTDTLTSPLDSL